MASAQVPVIRANGVAHQLFVDGRPFIILGGEVENSAASSAAYMAPIWNRLQAMGANTLLLPVGWDQLEPDEGRFDFALVDDMIAQARRHDMRIGILWLAAFKNARSTYAPTWVRADSGRFPRAVTAMPDHPTGAFTSTRAPVLSAFAPALLEADRCAFAALMRHIAAVDADHRVILVQVENETGILGDSRDRSVAAEAAWRSAVPQPLIDYLIRHADALTPELSALWAAQGRRRSGNWGQLFGRSPRAEEAFMAWTFGRYVESVASAGRSVLRLPFYANGWLGPAPGEPNPGDYPSGGPTAAMLDIWKAAAPSLDLLAPDIYVDDARAVQERYARADSPLLIPEERFRAGDLFWALGRHKALGQASYQIESARPGSRLESAYKMLRPMLPVIARAQAEDRISAVLLDGEEVQTVVLGGYEFTVRGADAYARRLRLDAGARALPPAPEPRSEMIDDTSAPDTRPFGLIVALDANRFLFVGEGFLADVTRHGRPAEIDRVEEGVYVDGVWHPGRRLNGDDYGRFVPKNSVGAAEVRLLP
ncbi:DUF5597 domain-containing protein [Sphingomonas bacterium]|uniref:GH35 family beta-galactosidase n=1 Tax=Sphingomonas bacterium TaxID=1895847 RepID=UPI0015756CBE|nr:DUF5597 domain-containing protein [Sphingomonas bacterium]